MARMGILIFFLIFEETFQVLIIDYKVSCGFLYRIFIMLRYVASVIILLRFNHE